jgi:cytochrome P450
MHRQPLYHSWLLHVFKILACIAQYMPSCRVELVARFRRAVKDPKLLQGSIPAALRDEYGADSNVITDNLIMVLFAGFETSTSLAVRLLYELARHPEALKKVRCSSV